MLTPTPVPQSFCPDTNILFSSVLPDIVCMCMHMYMFKPKRGVPKEKLKVSKYFMYLDLLKRYLYF